MREWFKTDECYDLYKYGVKKAKRVNGLILQGYTVCDEDGDFINQFVFQCRDGEPVVAIKDKVAICDLVCSMYDDDGLIWLEGDVTRESIDEIFDKLKYYKYQEVCL